MMRIKSMVVLGYGNLGFHLSKALLDAGMPLVQIYNRSGLVSPKPGQVSVVTQLEALVPDADLYWLCVRDEAIAPVAAQLARIVRNEKAIVVHTAGAAPLVYLSRHFSHSGVCWPLQSFSRQVATDFRQVPLGVESSDSHTENILLELSRSLSDRVYALTAEQRPRLHLAAVMANNFSNALYGLAAQQLETMQLPFDILRPLILQTAMKVQQELPVQVQTGPAIRDDRSTLIRHLALLEDEPEIRELYRILSRCINPQLDAL